METVAEEAAEEDTSYRTAMEEVEEEEMAAAALSAAADAAMDSENLPPQRRLSMPSSAEKVPLSASKQQQKPKGQLQPTHSGTGFSCCCRRYHRLVHASCLLLSCRPPKARCR